MDLLMLELIKVLRIQLRLFAPLRKLCKIRRRCKNLSRNQYKNLSRHKKQRLTLHMFKFNMRKILCSTGYPLSLGVFPHNSRHNILN